MGTTAHLSPLLQKARRLGLRDESELESIAISRGLQYFGRTENSFTEVPENGTTRADDLSLLSKEELVIALISPAARYSPNRIRMAAAMMAASGVSAEKIVRLSRQERCESIVGYIARCGATVEPENPFWQSLLKNLPETPPVKPDVLPHISRFVAMWGITRGGVQNHMQWIRPSP